MHLEQGLDDEGALSALHTFTQCADFDIDFLYLAALESQSKSALRCAQEAYTLLYKDVVKPGSTGAAKAASCPGYFAQLLVRSSRSWFCVRAHSLFAASPHQGHVGEVGCRRCRLWRSR